MDALEMQRRFLRAQQLLAAGRAAEAKQALAPVAAAAPDDPAVRQLMAHVLAAGADFEGAARELRAALARSPRRDRAVTVLQLQLAEVLAHAGRADEAEAALRDAFSADPRFAPAATALARRLAATGRAAEADRLLAPLAGVPDAELAAAHAEVMEALGRKQERVEQRRRAVAAETGNAVAWHNLAAAEGDLQRFAAAETATARALALGLAAPETWLVRARALAGLGRIDDAEAAFDRALALRPDYPEAHRDLAQMLWTQTGDLDRAVRRLDAALAARPDSQGLAIDRARLRQYAGDVAGADSALAVMAARPDAQPRLKATAAQVAVRLDPDRAARYAEEAVAAAPGDDDMLRTLAEARLAQGDWAGALKIADDLVARDPDNQGNLALQGTAWRLGGDSRRALRDVYPRLVRARAIDAPAGWPDLSAYLADLAAGLDALHGGRAHPIGQSLRGGTQTVQNLLESEHPAIRAFPVAAHGAITEYLAALGQGDDPVRSRNSGRYRFAGIWSVRLRSQGFHADHLHPKGWISSACYVAVPRAVEGQGHEGWLKFGEPGTPTRPPLAPEHFVKPEPGRLVLFPSYLWHGTVPFAGEEPRLTIAFDLLPG